VRIVIPPAFAGGIFARSGREDEIRAPVELRQRQAGEKEAGAFAPVCSILSEGWKL
jgi:hypothetical protein